MTKLSGWLRYWLFIPPSKAAPMQMLSGGVKRTSGIANVRIYVEQAIGRMKNFNILKHEIPVPLFSLMISYGFFVLYAIILYAMPLLKFVNRGILTNTALPASVLHMSVCLVHMMIINQSVTLWKHGVNFVSQNFSTNNSLFTFDIVRTQNYEKHVYSL